MEKQAKSFRRKKSDVDFETLGREFGKIPPQAVDIEKGILGAVLVDNIAAESVIGELVAEHFYQPRHRIIFSAMQELYEKNIAIDLLTLTEKLKGSDELEQVGGKAYLAELSNIVGSAAHVEFHKGILKQKAIQRGLISASFEIQRMSYDESIPVEDLMVNSQTKVYDVIKQNMRSHISNVREILNDVIDQIEKNQTDEGKRGVPTGYVELDRISMGWQPGNLIVIGARPGVGKSAIALNLAANAAIRGGVPVAFFSLEMTKSEITQRLIESETELPGDKIKGQSKMDNIDWKQLEVKLKGLNNSDIYIDETPAITTTEFIAKAKNLVHTKNVGLIFVDYLQLMRNPGCPTVREEVSEVSHKLKTAAKELGVPVIALAQLNRAAEQRKVVSLGKPILSDIKESGAIEQDADIVMFLHRPDQMGLSEDPAMKEYAEIIVAKNRNGAVRTIPMIYKESIVKFLEPSDSLSYQAISMSSKMNDSFYE